MNLRVIKKDIEYFINEFIEDCDLFLQINPDKGEKIITLMDEAVELYNNLKHKINNPDGPLKQHFNGVREEMFNKLDELCEKLSDTVASKGEAKEEAPAKAKAPAKPKTPKAAAKKEE